MHDYFVIINSAYCGEIKEKKDNKSTFTSIIPTMRFSANFPPLESHEINLSLLILYSLVKDVSQMCEVET